MYRMGNGLDFHILEINPERPFLLGGYEIETDLALVGHSDADILLHAISDSILGALALGDIGKYFPDTDDSLKNMDSKIILQKRTFSRRLYKWNLQIRKAYLEMNILWLSLEKLMGKYYNNR